MASGWGSALRVMAMVAALATASLSVVHAERWAARWTLVVGALCLLAAPLVDRSLWHYPATWHHGLAYAAVFAALWRFARGETRRRPTLWLALGLIVGAGMGFVPAGSPAECPALLAVPLGLLLPAAAGVCFGALADSDKDLRFVCGLALVSQGASLLAFVLLRQALVGALWGWDPLVVMWIVGLLVLLYVWIAASAPLFDGLWPRIGILLLLSFLMLGQALAARVLAHWLGYATICITG